MRRAIKTFLLTGLVLLGLLQGARAYTPGGPAGNNPKPNGGAGEIGDSWQQPVIGLNLSGDWLGPKMIGQEYRKNLPVMYYACDASFLNYFGSNGMAAVDQAFFLLNSAFTNNPTGITNGLDGYSGFLNEFPFDTRHFNYQAQALGVYDLKSTIMGAMMEQLGLADPVRFDWTLHDRAVGPGGCPGDVAYLVVQRNFDPVLTALSDPQTTPYVNNTLYSYQILEDCTGPNPLALSVPYSVDPLADTYSPVASFDGGVIEQQTSLGTLLSFAPGIFTYGSFYSGLTRDDVAGLRYLLTRTNIVTESPDPNSILYATATNIFHPTTFPAQTLTNGFGTNGGFYTFDGTFGYGDYGWLVATAKTNSPLQMQALYPGLLIDFANSTNDLEKATNWVFTQYFTNAGYGSPYGSPPILVTVSNAVVSWVPLYYTKFLNVFTNLFHPVLPTTTVTLQTTIVGPGVGAPYPSFGTNTTFASLTVNNPSGEFFLFLPFYTNYCLPDFVTILSTNVFLTTNVLANAATNIITATNTTGFSSTVAEISLFSNYTYEVYPVTCVTSTPATTLYQGIQKIQFVKAPYDSESGNFWSPVTNSYTLTAVTNNQPEVQYLQRILTTPDFDFAAEDLTTGPSSNPHPGVADFARSMAFNQLNAYSGEAGPGTILGPSIIYLNNSGPVFENFSGEINGTPFFTESPGGDTADIFYGVYYIWGSFDASTNPPTVYPDGTSILNFQKEIQAKITTTPPGSFTATNGSLYSVVFAESGGEYQPPFAWSTPGMPPGLSLISNPDSTATISGRPTQSGTFNFTLMLMDSLGRSGQWTYPITIHP